MAFHHKELKTRQFISVRLVCVNKAFTNNIIYNNKIDIEETEPFSLDFLDDISMDMIVAKASVLFELKGKALDDELWVEIPRITPGGRLKYTPQAGVEGMSLVKTSLDEQSENVKFSDQVSTQMYVVDSEMDKTRMLQDTNDAMLENFFKRPIKIREFEWGTGTTLAEDFNPWEDYFTNQRVIDRLTTFNLLRCKLHMKVMINGNGFQFGRAVLAYNPLDSFDDLSTHSALVPQDLVQTTQLPHVYLDPTTSQGGEMLLPFFYHKNYLSIPGGDWSEMGRCYLRSLNALKHANGASDLVTISVFAWAEEISMAVLTNTDFVAQSGEEQDEANKTGLVSGPASAISKAAKVASGISAIAPYAMATSKAADVIGGVAKLFGYCAPTMTKSPDPLKPTALSSLAITNVPSTAVKLTMDEKAELTIDPRIAGLGGDDPMNIRTIAARESYLTQFDWDIGTAPETLLWNSRVTPVTWAETGLTPNSYLFPPCAMAAIPFKYWTGSMKFRFQIVCSSFHKGRLKFVYDPNHIDTVEYNTNYMKIVDISKEQDFTMEIGNGQPFTLLDHANPGPDSVTEVYSTTAYTGNAPGNGTLSVYVLNELTTPNSVADNDIQINVFVSAGEDFEVFVPDSSLMTRYTFFAQSGFEPQAGVETAQEIVPESQGTMEPSAPIQVMMQKLGPGEQDLSDINKVFTGESIASFRSLLKRGALHERVELLNGRSVTMGIRCMFPFYRGNAPDAVHTTLAAAPYNYVNTLLLHWVRTAFAGHRGSIRWKLLPVKHSNTNDDLSIYTQRCPLGIGSEYFNASAATDTGLSASSTAKNAVQNGFVNIIDPLLPATALDGAHYNTVKVNNIAEIEVPWYSPYRFSPGKESSYTGIETFDPTWRFSVHASNSDQSQVDLWTATGEDFQVYMWTGLPRVYYESTVPDPAV